MPSGKIIARLIVNDRPTDNSEKRDFLCVLIVSAIEVSRLNERDPDLATKHPFDGKLKFSRERITKSTSIFRLICDVECLLRELFGDVEGDDLEKLRHAIWTIVMEFTEHLCSDIHQKYRDTYEYEYDQAWVVAADLANRAMQVSVHPHDYSWLCRWRSIGPNLISLIPESLKITT
jgi:hypothetical protein